MKIFIQVLCLLGMLAGAFIAGTGFAFDNWIEIVSGGLLIIVLAWLFNNISND